MNKQYDIKEILKNIKANILKESTKQSIVRKKDKRPYPYDGVRIVNKKKRHIVEYEESNDSGIKTVELQDITNVEFVLTPQLSWLNYKAYEKEYIKDYDYGHDFLLKLKEMSIEDKLNTIYRRFKDYNSAFIVNEKIKTNTYRVVTKKRFMKEGERITFIHVYTVHGNELCVNELTYHKQLLKLNSITTTKIPDFKKFVQSLGFKTDSHKAKYLRKELNGFIVHNNTVIVFNKLDYKKNGEAIINTLHFMNR